MNTRIREIITHLLGDKAPPRQWVQPSTRLQEGAKAAPRDRSGAQDYQGESFEVLTEEELTLSEPIYDIHEALGINSGS